MDMSEMPPVDMEDEEGKGPNRLFLGLVIAMVVLLVVGLVGVMLFRMRGDGGGEEVAELTPTPSGAAVAAQSIATTAPTATPTGRPTNTPVVLLAITDTPASDAAADTSDGSAETPTIDIGGDVSAEGGTSDGPTETPTIDIGGGTTEKGGESAEPTETATIDIGGGTGPTPTSVIKGPTVIVIPVDTPTQVVPVSADGGETPQTGFGLEALLGGAALGVILLIARRLRLTS